MILKFETKKIWPCLKIRNLKIQRLIIIFIPPTSYVMAIGYLFNVFLLDNARYAKICHGQRMVYGMGSSHYEDDRRIIWDNHLTIPMSIPLKHIKTPCTATCIGTSPSKAALVWSVPWSWGNVRRGHIAFSQTGTAEAWPALQPAPLEAETVFEGQG